MKQIKILLIIWFTLLLAAACTPTETEDLPWLSSPSDSDQEYANSYIIRGDDLLDRGDFDQTIAHYDIAIELYPGNAAAFNNRGLAYLNSGNYDQAIEDFDRAIELDPEAAYAYYYRGMSKLEIGEKQNAILDLEQAIDLGLPPETQAETEDLLEDLSQ